MKILHMTYIQRNKVDNFRQQNAQENISGRATFQAKVQSMTYIFT